ncbi:hypothetical protein OG804_01025 [Nocardia sp. NBC_00416]
MTVDAAGRGTVLIGKTCVDGIVVGYMITLHSPPDGVREERRSADSASEFGPGVAVGRKC